MIDPRIAHTIDARTLLVHVHNLDQSDLHDLRREFARFLSTRRNADFNTWQEAFNTWSRANPHTGGRIEYRTSRCPECKGRGFTTRHIARNMSRTGNPYMCPDCRGSRRGKLVTKQVRYIDVPTTTEAPTNLATEN